MTTFSERYGYKSKKVFQREAINDSLRTRIWNLLTIFLWDYLKQATNHEQEFNKKEVINFSKQLWDQFFKESLDYFYIEETPVLIKNKYDSLKWHEVYDLVEFTIQNYPFFPFKNFISIIGLNNNLDCFREMLNKILKQESSAYRVIGNKVTEITAKEEIIEIEEAIHDSSNETKLHLQRALELLSDRKNPDYRNSIKESISAVEAICKKISGDEKSTLGRALNSLTSSGVIQIHEDLAKGYKKIYHYTSDDDGIRHSLKDAPNVDAEDARYMLVSCSAFVNYLRVKADKAGIII